ncbi:MAG: LytTR family transcriptional regulator DNA-binding domain-containing protein [Lachnospiraceae bacterium]
MKVTIIDIGPNEEEEIVIKCNFLNDDIVKLINHLKQGSRKITVYKDGRIYFIIPEEVFYFESVDQKVFAYCESEVYQVKSKLYELIEELPNRDFIRISKSSILNLNQIKSLTPAFGGRYEALLKNGEKVIISRQYVGLLKEQLGV